MYETEKELIRNSLNWIYIDKPYDFELFVAGGVFKHILTGDISESNDIDVWSNNPKKAIEFFNKRFKVKNDTNEYYKEYIGENDLTVQLITAVKKYSPAFFIHDFDFTCCSISYDGKSIYDHKTCIQDIYNKRLRFREDFYISWVVLKRVFKYYEYGYRFSLEDEKMFFTSLSKRLKYNGKTVWKIINNEYGPST